MGLSPRPASQFWTVRGHCQEALPERARNRLDGAKEKRAPIAVATLNSCADGPPDSDHKQMFGIADYDTESRHAKLGSSPTPSPCSLAAADGIESTAPETARHAAVGMEAAAPETAPPAAAGDESAAPETAHPNAAGMESAAPEAALPAAAGMDSAAPDTEAPAAADARDVSHAPDSESETDPVLLFSREESGMYGVRQ